MLNMLLRWATCSLVFEIFTNKSSTYTSIIFSNLVCKHLIDQLLVSCSTFFIPKDITLQQYKHQSIIKDVCSSSSPYMRIWLQHKLNYGRNKYVDFERFDSIINVEPDDCIRKIPSHIFENQQNQTIPSYCKINVR